MGEVASSATAGSAGLDEGCGGRRSGVCEGVRGVVRGDYEGISVRKGGFVGLDWSRGAFGGRSVWEEFAV